MSEHVRKGALVRYHGSLTQYVGKTMTVEDIHPCYGGSTDPDGNIVQKYTLRYGPKFRQYIDNIRRESFTPLEG